MATFKEFLNERNITLKRRYTEAHPAKTVGSSARVRNAIIEALKDGKITVAEFNDIVAQHSSAPAKWTRGNKRFFKIEEDGVSLSRYGQKILTSLVTESSVDEKSFDKMVSKSKYDYDDVPSSLDLKDDERNLDEPAEMKNIKKFQKKYGTKTKVTTDNKPIGKRVTVYMEPGVEDGPDEIMEPQLQRHEEMMDFVKKHNLKISIADTVKGEWTFWTRYGVDESTVTEARVNEAKFVKDFNRDVLKAKTKDEVSKLYPNAEFFIGKLTHFFGKLQDNLFFKADYIKGRKEFEIKSVYSQKGRNYVHLYLNEATEPITEARYDKKKLLKRLGDADDATVQTGDGKEYIIYNPNSNNKDNAAMWHANSVSAVDQDGDEYEIPYKDIKLVITESAVTEARASAEKLLKSTAKGETNAVEGIKLSKEMASCFLDWLKGSTYGKKFSDLPFEKLFMASFNWGLDRYIKPGCKGEFKELKTKAKAMKESTIYADFNQFVNESLNEKSIKDWFTANIDSFKDEKEYMKAGKKAGFSKKELEAAMDDFEQGGEDYLESNEVNENYEVIYSDGVSAMKKFSNERKARAFFYDKIRQKGMKNAAIYKADSGFHSTSQTEYVVAFWGDGSYLDNVSKKDAELAKKKVTESIDEGLNKSDVAYQLAIDYTGRTKPKITKLNKKRIEIRYGYKISPQKVIDSIKTVHPEVELKHVEWSDKMTGGGFHIFDILEANKVTEKRKDRHDFKVGDIIGNTVNGYDFKILKFVGGNKVKLRDIKTKREFVAYKSNYELDRDHMLEESFKLDESFTSKLTDIARRAKNVEDFIKRVFQHEKFKAFNTPKTQKDSYDKFLNFAKNHYEMVQQYESNESVNEAKDPYKEIKKAIKGMKGVSAEIKGDEIRVSNKAGDEFIYSMLDNDDIEEFISSIKESKNNMIHTKFTDFVNETYMPVNEALKSSKLRGLISMKKGSKDILKAIYGFSKIALDKIEDHQIQDIDPKQGKKAEGLVVYYTTQDKENPYVDRSSNSSWTQSGNFRFEANTILGIGMGKDVAYMTRHYDRKSGKTAYSLSTQEKSFSGSNQDIGINKKYRGWDSTGVYNVKRMIDLADGAFVINPKALPDTDLKTYNRAKAKEGAVAFKSDKEFKDANMQRYEEILQKRASTMDIDRLVEDAISDMAEMMKDAIKNKQKNKYGEIIAGVGEDGRAYKINDISNFTSNLLRDYERWAGYMATIASKEDLPAQKDLQWEIKYAQREAKKYAKEIRDRLAKLKKRNIAW